MSFEKISFENKVRDALQAVERILDVEKKPRIAGNVDHNYIDKYELVNVTANTAIIAYMNVLERFGLTTDVLKSIDKSKPTTIRFEASTKLEFLKEVVVDVPMNWSYMEEEESKSPGKVANVVHHIKETVGSKTRVAKVVQHVREFQYKLDTSWSVSIYSGTSVDDKKVIKSRNSTTTIITQSRGDISSIPEHENHAPVELSMTWFLQQIDTNDLTSHFNVNTESDATKTPRRNEATEQAIDFSQRLRKWCRFIRMHFIYLAERILRKHHAPALPMQHPSTKIILDKVQGKYSIFVPILPLMEDGNREGGIDINQVENKSILSFRSTENDEAGSSTMLPMTDMSKLLNEHVRTLEEALDGVVKSCSPDQNDIISSSEVIFTLLCDHVFDLASMFSDCMAYIESMMENQLIAAIGKRLTSEDLDNFVRFHNSKLLLPAPKPFSHSICRPEHYPVGLISIESQNGENTCIYSHTREVYPSSSLKIPLTAATVLELTGEQHLHGWMQHKFGSSHKSHQLIARARQFSSFILVIGSMNGPAALEPKDAIIVQNKDEVLIPLLLDELPTAKEFKDAVKSLSTEQQRFANAYRSMQLESSIFGICVIQVKPQLESLLRLPPDALDKEMKLTNDLMDLFVEYQVPSDLLSYNGLEENVAAEDKVSNVRDHVKSVLDVINAEKEKQLNEAKLKTDMAIERAYQEDSFAPFRAQQEMVNSAGGLCGAIAYSAAVPVASSSRRMRKTARTPVLASIGAMRYEPIPSNVELDDGSLDLCFADSTGPDVTEMNENLEDKTSNLNLKASIGNVTHGVVDFTLIPKILDVAVDKNGEGTALRSTIIKAGDVWERNRQENLLTGPKKETLNSEGKKSEKNRAFDLLDALSRSGSLPLKYTELHVVVALTHCFENDVIGTVIRDNINPIEKLEMSTLLLASAVHGVPPRELIKDANELRRLEMVLPLLLQQ